MNDQKKQKIRHFQGPAIEYAIVAIIAVCFLGVESRCGLIDATV